MSEEATLGRVDLWGGKEREGVSESGGGGGGGLCVCEKRDLLYVEIFTLSWHLRNWKPVLV